MTTLPTNDTAVRQANILEAVVRCRPNALIRVLPVWTRSLAKEQGWSIEIIEASTRPDYVRHDTYTEALRYWDWEWRLLNAIEFCEALALIEQPHPDEPPEIDDLFGGMGDGG